MMKQVLKKTKVTFMPDDLRFILAKEAGLKSQPTLKFRVVKADGTAKEVPESEAYVMWVELCTEVPLDEKAT